MATFQTFETLLFTFIYTLYQKNVLLCNTLYYVSLFSLLIINALLILMSF